ncbi:MAG: nucleoside recognition protein [Clostridiaceae bacterium]|nr:nucleoside recognition protein [Clostridiaceae bacterium]
MLNIIWPVFILISFAYGILNGNVDKINQSIFESASSSVQLCITFFGTICLWNGIMKIAQKTSVIVKLTKILKPLINFLFPECKEQENIKQEISMNMVANILGLGNAATPLGLKVMKSLQKENTKKDTITSTMAMFIVINTASLQLIPTTVIAIRSSLNSANPTKIIFPVWIATLCAAVAVVISTKIFIYLDKNKYKTIRRKR